MLAMEWSVTTIEIRLTVTDLKKEVLERAAEFGQLSQWVQMKIWEYMDTPKEKRDATDVAQEIIDKISLAQKERDAEIVRDYAVSIQKEWAVKYPDFAAKAYRILDGIATAITNQDEWPWRHTHHCDRPTHADLVDVECVTVGGCLKYQKMSPTQRTLKLLRDNGYLAGIVEKVIPKVFIRKDLFGICDILALKGTQTLCVQCTSGTNVSSHIHKINALEEKQWLLNANWKIIVIGWKKKKIKRGGTAFKYIPRIIEMDEQGEQEVDEI